jgi:hypothetical protein
METEEMAALATAMHLLAGPVWDARVAVVSAAAPEGRGRSRDVPTMHEPLLAEPEAPVVACALRSVRKARRSSAGSLLYSSSR